MIQRYLAIAKEKKKKDLEQPSPFCLVKMLFETAMEGGLCLDGIY